MLKAELTFRPWTFKIGDTSLLKNLKLKIGGIKNDSPFYKRSAFVNRRRARGLAFKILFQNEFQKLSDREAFLYFRRQPEYKSSQQKHLAFAKEILEGCRSHSEHIDGMIERRKPKLDPQADVFYRLEHYENRRF